MTLERDDPQIRTQNWVESHNPRNQQDQINIMTGKVNQGFQLILLQSETILLQIECGLSISTCRVLYYFRLMVK